MKIIESYNYSKDKINRLARLYGQAKQNLKRWAPKFNFDSIKYSLDINSINAVGTYDPKTNTISISRNLCEENSDSEVLTVAYHEFCHYMVHAYYHLDNLNLHDVAPGLFSSDKVIVNLISGESDRELALDEFKQTYPSIASLSNSCFEFVFDNYTQDEGHGPIWKIFAKAVSTRTALDVERYYTAGNTVKSDAQYKLSCDCGYQHFLSPTSDNQNDRTILNNIKNVEWLNSHSIICPKCKKELKVEKI